MKIQIEVEIDNSAFQDNPNELRQTLGQIPHELQAGQEGTLRDSNGNRVGYWSVED